MYVCKPGILFNFIIFVLVYQAQVVDCHCSSIYNRLIWCVYSEPNLLNNEYFMLFSVDHKVLNGLMYKNLLLLSTLIPITKQSTECKHIIIVKVIVGRAVQ